MMAFAFPSSFCAAVALAVGAVFFSTSSCPAADASPWDSGSHSAVRLIVGRPEEAAGKRIWRAGLEIKLQPGWKTYWRYPGDSGVPPRFDFSRSTNVEDVTVLWPAPMRFQDGGGMSIGYADRVVFPLRVEPGRARTPVTLDVKLDYAVCEKLCIPVEANARLVLDSDGSVHDAALTASERRVPQRVAIGAAGPLAIMAMKPRTDGRAGVIVDIKAPDGDPVDLFAEGPTAEWSLPLPQPLATAPPGLQRFTFDLDGLPAGADPRGAALTLTAVTPAHVIEVVTRLD